MAHSPASNRGRKSVHGDDSGESSDVELFAVFRPAAYYVIEIIEE